jgi:mannose-6-phosphate isomerase-like protein (cupin superfamily)
MPNRHVVVTKDGRSTIRANIDTKTYDFEHTPGFAVSTIWETKPRATPARPDEDPAETLTSFHPAPGGTVFMTMTVPPDEVYFAPGFDPALAGAEAFANSPGIADRFEIDNPGFHTTDTVDYIIVLDGEIVLKVDDGETVLKTGDIAIQNATHHAWGNRSGRTATIAVVLVGTHLP